MEDGTAQYSSRLTSCGHARFASWYPTAYTGTTLQERRMQARQLISLVKHAPTGFG